MIRRPKAPPLIRGGQGRSTAQLLESIGLRLILARAKAAQARRTFATRDTK